MITDKDLKDRFSRLPKWAQDELNRRDHMIKSLTDEIAAMRGEIANPFVWARSLSASGMSARPILGAEHSAKSVLIGSDVDNAYHIGVSGNTLRIMGRNLGENLIVKPHAANVVEIMSARW